MKDKFAPLFYNVHYWPQILLRQSTCVFLNNSLELISYFFLLQPPFSKIRFPDLLEPTATNRHFGPLPSRWVAKWKIAIPNANLMIKRNTIIPNGNGPTSWSREYPASWSRAISTKKDVWWNARISSIITQRNWDWEATEMWWRTRTQVGDEIGSTQICAFKLQM